LDESIDFASDECAICESQETAADEEAEEAIAELKSLAKAHRLTIIKEQ
jgi:hypothetical protein